MAYEDEHKERAYQHWKIIKEYPTFVHVEVHELIGMAKTLGMSPQSLDDEFHRRYESEQDNLEKIRVDASNPGYGVDIRTDKDVSAWALDLIDRTIVVMELDR